MKEHFEIQKACAFCEHSSPLYGEERCICVKKGVVSSDYICRSFVYDLTKRPVFNPPEINDLSTDDFKL